MNAAYLSTGAARAQLGAGVELAVAPRARGCGLADATLGAGGGLRVVKKNLKVGGDCCCLIHSDIGLHLQGSTPDG